MEVRPRPTWGRSRLSRTSAPEPGHDLTAERGDVRRIVDELRRLDADRGEPASELPRNRLERPAEIRDAGRVVEPSARAPDQLQVVHAPTGLRHGSPKPCQVVLARGAQRVEPVTVRDEPPQEPLVKGPATEPERGSVLAERLRLQIDVGERV